MKKLNLFFFAILLCALLPAQNTINLAGRWNFQIDREDTGIKQEWFKRTSLDDHILLPGSMPERLKGDPVTAQTVWTGSLYDSTYYYSPAMEKYRQEGNIKLPFFLTPERHYVGVAWYQRSITLPKDWKGRRMILYLERPHIETTVWVNGTKAGMQNSLCTPHLYDLTSFLKAGKENTIAIRIDNRIKEAYDVGQDSHSITDQTQGNWNGIVGRMELQSVPKAWIQSIQVYPDVAQKEAVVRIRICTEKPQVLKGSLHLNATSFNSPESPRVKTIDMPLPALKNPGVYNLEATLSLGDDQLLWSEFHPALYRLSATLKTQFGAQTQETEFGMRDFKIEGKNFYVNGIQTLLRGTVENCDFPLTGYAPMDLESWIGVFRKCKEYGLNHMRFHSFCPPEAAFKAADRVGFYLQPEAGSWPNHGVKLGYHKPIDQYLLLEGLRMSAFYGNSPSFCMFAIGNEPAGRWVDAVADMNEVIKAADSRRVYTGASVGGSWQWQPRSEFHVKAGARGLDWNRRMPESMSDYRERIDTVKQPYVSHETGQWCAFPNFEEIDQYTGVHKAKNFEIFRDILAENHLADRAHPFLMASGKLQILCYKHEIEKTLRTPNYAGFQLLALNDYSGQGSALVGPLNVFFREKGYIDAEEWGRFCAPTVLLARMPKFVYTDHETLRATFEAAHFAASPVPLAKVGYRITDADGRAVKSGSIGEYPIPIGQNIPLGELNLPLTDFQTPAKLNLELFIEDTPLKNDWDFWVYPSELPEPAPVSEESVLVTDTLGPQAIDCLQHGGKVLILAAGKICYGKDIVQHFSPVFWNTSWFKMRPPHTTGLWIDNEHPLFRNFPTEYHSNLQWWELVNRAQVMQLSDFPAEFQPTVQTIDTWFLSRKAGMLFEANVLNGRLLMTSMDLTSNPDERVVARQLYQSVLDYMHGDEFQPQHTVAAERIADLFTKIAPPVSSYTKSSPDELRPVTHKAGR